MVYQYSIYVNRKSGQAREEKAHILWSEKAETQDLVVLKTDEKS